MDKATIHIDDWLSIEVSYSYKPEVPSRVTGNPDTDHDGEPEEIDVLIWHLMVDGRKSYGSADLDQSFELNRIRYLYEDEINEAIRKVELEREEAA